MRVVSTRSIFSKPRSLVLSQQTVPALQKPALYAVHTSTQIPPASPRESRRLLLASGVVAEHLHVQLLHLAFHHRNQLVQQSTIHSAQAVLLLITTTTQFDRVHQLVYFNSVFDEEYQPLEGPRQLVSALVREVRRSVAAPEDAVGGT